MIESIKNIKPEDHKDNIVNSAEGKFGSVLVGDKFVWKKYDEDKLSNAVNAFIYWNNLKKQDYNNFFRLEQKTVEKTISTLKKNLKLVSRKYKLDEIEVYYDKNQGKWYDGKMHFVDYLWDDVCAEIDKKYGKWTDRSFFLVDDIYVLDAMRVKKLYLQHNISKDKQYIKAVTEALKMTQDELTSIKKISKYNSSKSLEIIFN